MLASLRRTAALATLLVIAVSGSMAQPAIDLSVLPEIRPGQTVHGTITAESHTFLSGYPFVVHRFEAQEGERYLIDLHSMAFDAYLTLVRPVGGITELVREDDDSGGGTDARIRFRAPRSGPYLVVVQGFGMEDGTGGLGPYRLGLQQLPAPPVAEARPLQVGTPVRGELADRDPILHTDGEESEIFYHLYRLDARAGQSLLITLDSDEFDAYLQFGPLRDGEVEVTHVDDDGGEATNARLHVVIPADGAYGIQARSYGEHETGLYTLRVREWNPPPVTTRPIAPGREVTAELTSADAELPGRGFVQHWTFDGRAGDRVRVRMRSDDFDTYALVGRVVDGAFTELASNDDAADDGTNSMVELTLPADGPYVVRATTFAGGATGTYTVHVEPLGR
jgi:hypothetical protein